MQRLIPFAILCLYLSFPVVAQAQKVPSDTTVKATIRKACALLLQNQENYEADRPLRSLPDPKVPEWQKKEQARLKKLRKSAKGKAQEWPYEGVYRVRPKGAIPSGYRLGGSSIVCLALLDAPGMDQKRRDAIERSTKFMLDMIDKDPGMASRKQLDYDVRGWGWAYCIRFFVRGLESGFFSEQSKLTDRVKKTIPELIKRLKVGQVEGGGWNYSSRGCSPFMTGSTLIALYNAKAAGFSVDKKMVEDALDALERGRGESMAYAYAGKLRNPREPMQGASARSAVAELALVRGGRSNIENLRKAVSAFYVEENWQELLKRKSKQRTHLPPYGVAPYYFFYGHTYAALAAEHLPEQEKAAFRKKMRELLWRTVEKKGAWNDRIFPRTESYATAMSILALIAPELPPVHLWKKKK